jgi:Uma2 family endonuclease
MPPTGGATGHRNLKIAAQLDRWAEADGTGVAFDSSTGFTLPDGGTRSPDAAWVRRDRLASLPPEQKERFVPLCPDFAIELRSPSDTLPDLLDKMEEYVANGLHLGWLIDPGEERVYAFRPDGPRTMLDAPTALNGAPVLPGFTLELAPIWNPEL